MLLLSARSSHLLLLKININYESLKKELLLLVGQWDDDGCQSLMIEQLGWKVNSGGAHNVKCLVLKKTTPSTKQFFPRSREMLNVLIETMDNYTDRCRATL